jgi:lipoprotein-releasing system permease protein
MKYERFIAKRYLVSKHKINFITVISILSVLGITIGVASLIIVLSVFNGFGSLVTSFLINFDPNIRVELISENSKSIEGNLEKRLNNINEVRNYSKFVNGKVLAYRSHLTEIVNLKGIEGNKDKNIYNIESSIVLGKFDLSVKDGIPGIVLGLPLADHLQSIIGDTLTLISPAGIEKYITQLSMPKTEKFIIRGIYISNNNEYDGSYIFTNLPTVQKLLGYNSNVEGYDIMLTDINESENVKEKLEVNLDKNIYSINTWYDFHKDLYSVMQIERWTAYIILSLIIAVATFNILGSLSMSVIEKQRDIGILRSMGVGENSVLKIFMYEGLLIGIAGTLAGVILGYFICWLQLQFNIYPLDPTQYKIDSLPLQIKISDFFFITGASMFLTYLASLIPAKKASKVNPLEAIKWE